MNEHAMDAPYRPAALDKGAQGLIGRGIDRYEGPLKVSGTAQYAFEGAPDGTLYAHIVGATIGAGKVLSIDASAAEAIPGVVKVIVEHPDFPSSGGSSREDMGDWTDEIDHFGQPVAMIVAESLEIARVS
jgi:xanthine dehydrogenase YagR molybdenum-binding subunit